MLDTLSVTKDDDDDSYNEVFESPTVGDIPSTDLHQPQPKPSSRDYGSQDPSRASYKKLSDYLDKEPSRPASSASRASSHTGRNAPADVTTNRTQSSRPPSSYRTMSAHLDTTKYDSRPASSLNSTRRTDEGSGLLRPSSSMMKGSSFSSRGNELQSALTQDPPRPPSSSSSVLYGFNSERDSSRPTSSPAPTSLQDYSASGKIISRPTSSSEAHYLTAGRQLRPSSALAASNFLKIDDEPDQIFTRDSNSIATSQRKFSSGSYSDINMNTNILQRPASSRAQLDVDIEKPWSVQSKASTHKSDHGLSRAESRQSNADAHMATSSLEFHDDGENINYCSSSCC